MDINQKKIFIYKNINKIQYHNEIIKYIEDNNIKYASNNNGFFVLLYKKIRKRLLQKDSKNSKKMIIKKIKK